MSAVHDVVIVGAGPAGSSAAFYLARRGVDVLLLDKSRFPRDKTCGDGLTPRALAVLRDMGILDDLLRVGCRVSGIDMFAPRGHELTVPVPSAPGSAEYLLIVPRLILDDAIRRRALAGGAAFQEQVDVVSVEREGDGVVVRGDQLGRPVAFRARLAIVATGASLGLLRTMGIVEREPRMMLAARAYFEGMAGLSDRIQCHFDGVPLPGYGWIFPISPTAANVGTGVIPVGLAGRLRRIPPRRIFDSFIQTPLLQRILGSAQRVGPVKGYPIRIDFHQARTFADRVLLVGEAAGLANPLTGEGIDYALESGQIAAEHVSAMLASGDLSPARLAGYDRQLRQRFQRLFVMSSRLRGLYFNPPLLNRLVKAARRHAGLRSMIGNVTVGNNGLDQGLSLGTLFQVAFTP
ncbi:MAG: geranylgeranyl reductase family protein [Chloroflexi bacterium]|nr:geranylgeranyl reductase family protein [Chloroflexota bacterium]